MRKLDRNGAAVLSCGTGSEHTAFDMCGRTGLFRRPEPNGSTGSGCRYVLKSAAEHNVLRVTVILDSDAVAVQLNGSHDNNQKRREDHQDQSPNVECRYALLDGHDSEPPTNESQFTTLLRVNQNPVRAIRHRPEKECDFQEWILKAIEKHILRETRRAKQIQILFLSNRRNAQHGLA
jgi:hypothetical protein